MLSRLARCAGLMTFTLAAVAGRSAFSCDTGARGMNILAVQHEGPLAINMNQPVLFVMVDLHGVGGELGLIAVMVVIVPPCCCCSRGESSRSPHPPADPADGGTAAAGTPAGDDGTAGMWTARVRCCALGALPPDKLLPDRQPLRGRGAWVYVFGVGSLAALGVAIVSGFGLALGGPDWRHYNPAGHLLQQPAPVERAVHGPARHRPVWGKFWMAAWRGCWT